MLSVVGVFLLLLSFTTGNVGRTLWLFVTTVDTLRALKSVRANGRAIGVRTRRKHLRESLVCWIVLVAAQPVSWVAERVLGWLPFYRSIKTLLVLVCAFWRLETSALLYQGAIVPVLKRYERRIDLSFSLLDATLKIIYHWTIVLPLFIAQAALPLRWRSSSHTTAAVTIGAEASNPKLMGESDERARTRGDIDINVQPCLSTSPGAGREKERSPSRNAPPGNSNKLPQWPPPKRSVYSEAMSSGKCRTTIPPLSRTRSTRAAKERLDEAQPCRAPNAEHRPSCRGSQLPTTSGLARVAGQSSNAAKDTRVQATVAKLLSLPTPPTGTGGPGERKSFSSDRRTLRQATSDLGAGYDNEVGPQRDRTSPKKRPRDEQSTALSPPKRRASRKKAVTVSGAEANNAKDVYPARRPATTKDIVNRREDGQLSQASGRRTQPKPKAGLRSMPLSTTAGKRARDKEMDKLPSRPKRTRSARSSDSR